ncbi:MAG: type VI secretion system baseplate subunit TssF [Deltaproteobacteria bacterium]|nr:type VI secretion system baseplate subunit TssF [Deltaproteobacteria bacterium]
MKAKSEEILEYYKRELAYLRRMGTAFAEQYPKVAGRLELGIDQCPDPHIERLIEAFAFLTARIQFNIESEFPQISTAFLGILYPHFLNPTPSMGVARLEVDPDQGKLTTGHLIPKHTPLFTQSLQGQNCRFRTCYPVTLWPLEVTYAGFESTDQFDFLDASTDVAVILRLRVESRQGPLSELELKRLRFYINGERMLVNALYELLYCHINRLAILPEKAEHPIFLPEGSILPVGFGEDEEVLPYALYAHSGYRLLQEYFTFPEKFMFFDVDHLDTLTSDRFFDILIMLDRMPETRLTIDKNTFCLGCTPVINLFRKTSEPIRLDERHTEYLLVPDKRREKITEIHTILSVSASPRPGETSKEFEPFFSFSHHMERTGHKAYWIAKRQPTGKKDLPGTEMLFSFVDLDFDPHLPPATTVFAHTLCTNRRLAEEIPVGAILQIEESAPLSQISMLTKPTPQEEPPLEGATLWRLISHLSLNYLSLSNEEESLKALREILRLYSISDRADTFQQISGIREMKCRKVIRRMGSDAWRGFCRGTEVTLVFDERLYVGNSALLLASVLNRFLSLYASVNSFTQLIIYSHQREGIWKKWNPIAGEQIIL